MLTAIVSIFFYAVVLIWSLALFAVMLVVFALTAAFDRERVVLHLMSKMWARSLFLLNPLWKVRVYGKENLDPEKAYVITVNHQSFFDIPIMYFLPRINFKWVAKTWVYRIPLFGAVMWLHGDITVKESGSVKMTKKMMDEGQKHLRKGTSVIVFPEGTRSLNGEIGPYRDGAFTLARRAGVEVLPCVMNGMKSYLNGWRVRRNVFEISILPPVSADRVCEMPARELREGVRDRSVAELDRLRGREQGVV